jgi:hypothetical protein
MKRIPVEPAPILGGVPLLEGFPEPSQLERWPWLVEPGPAAALRVSVAEMAYVNDRFGHRGGDELLDALGRALAAAFRGLPAVRVGGDAFAALLHPDALPTPREISELESRLVGGLRRWLETTSTLRIELLVLDRDWREQVRVPPAWERMGYRTEN